MTAPAPVVVVTRAVRAVIGELTWDGADNATIAARLRISEHTVRSHMKTAMRATGMPSRTALAVALLRRQVLLHTVPIRTLDERHAA